MSIPREHLSGLLIRVILQSKLSDSGKRAVAEDRFVRIGQLDQLFNPTSIAVFGASDSGGSVGSRVFANLLSGDFAGPIVPINPKYSEVAGKQCYPTLADVGQSIDLAVVATPAATVGEILHQCGEAGVRHAIVLSAGFGETGAAGKALETELVEVARRADVRLLGPNCVGLVRPWLGLNATFLKAGTPKGDLALVSQSGALCSAISDWAGPRPHVDHALSAPPGAARIPCRRDAFDHPTNSA